MRYAISVLVILSLSASVVFGQEQRPKVDVIYLKNGGERRGQIISRKPGESITIETVDGQVFVYELSEIEKVVRGTSSSQSQKVTKKNPFLAFGLSFLFPGGGQYYNEQYIKGGIITGLTITGVGLLSEEDTAGFGSILILGSSLYSMIDAPIVAGNINDRASNRQSYGHLMELRGGNYTIGVDPIPSRKGVGMKLALHF